MEPPFVEALTLADREHLDVVGVVGDERELRFH